MILDHKTIGNLYWNVCDRRRNIDLNAYAKDLADTVRYMIDLSSSDIMEEHGRYQMLYALAEIFTVILEDEKQVKYSRLFLTIPEQVMGVVIKINLVVNKDEIEKGITPRDYFKKPESGNVDYFK